MLVSSFSVIHNGSYSFLPYQHFIAKIFKYIEKQKILQRTPIHVHLYAAINILPYLLYHISIYFSSESEVTQSCPTLCDPVDCGLRGSSVHGILQARILEWVAISFSGGSSQPRDRTWVAHIGGRHFNLWANREALFLQASIHLAIHLFWLLLHNKLSKAKV